MAADPFKEAWQELEAAADWHAIAGDLGEVRAELEKEADTTAKRGAAFLKGAEQGFKRSHAPTLDAGN